MCFRILKNTRDCQAAATPSAFSRVKFRKTHHFYIFDKFKKKHYSAQLLYIYISSLQGLIHRKCVIIDIWHGERVLNFENFTIFTIFDNYWTMNNHPYSTKILPVYDIRGIYVIRGNWACPCILHVYYTCICPRIFYERKPMHNMRIFYMGVPSVVCPR